MSDVPRQPVDPAALRDQADAALAAGDWPAARAALAQLWDTAPAPAAAAPFVVSRFEKLRGHVPLTPCKLAILRSFTVEPLVPLLRAMAFVGGIDLDVRLGEFNTFHQEIIDPASWLYRFDPNVVIVAAHARDVAPVLWYGSSDAPADGSPDPVRQVAEQFATLIDQFRARCAAHLIVHNLQTPPTFALGILDAQRADGQAGAVRAVNRRLAELAAATRNVYVLDYDHLVARRGADQFEDLRKWLTVRLPVQAGELSSLAREWLRFLHPITGRVCKCLAVDLDNTLWGGVIGEDGMDGIQLDSGHRGFAWHALQRALLDLHARGVLLAIASKNNPPEATEAIESHPGMLLRMHHFAAVRINWNDKATSLREIAAELNIGIDALAFLDDNPVERAWVRGQLPDVTVIELPDDPMRYAAAVRDAPVFERLSLTEEDRARGRMYAEQRMRSQLQSSATSLEDFYRSLQMRVEVAPVTPATLSRTAQLTQKTNQFNLTTRRYSEQQIAEFAADPAWNVYTTRVADRMGDNGLVGVVITRDAGDVAEIDSFLLSCRVIGRTVETALLAHVAGEARARGKRTLRGWYLPTKKNAPCKDFYGAHGFRPQAAQGEATQWELDLTDSRLSSPPWIELRTSPGAS